MYIFKLLICRADAHQPVLAYSRQHIEMSSYSAANTTQTPCHTYATATRNSSEDEIANVNFLYDDIVHALQNTIDSCINSATRGCVGTPAGLPKSVT